jgi:hypothetical protein
MITSPAIKSVCTNTQEKKKLQKPVANKKI